VHPAQLSLLPDQVPAPAPTLLAELPEQDVAEAIGLLGALIAKASASEKIVQAAEVSADE
jgi:hypothetical protein